MKKQIALIMFCIMLLCSCGGHSEMTTWQEQYDLGVRYLSEGNYEEAIIAFTAAIEIDPKQSPAFVGRGDAHSGIARTRADGVEELPTEAVSSYESALEDYLVALDLDESVAEVYRKAAEAYITLDDLDSALEILERGIKATKDDELQTYLNKLSLEQSLFILARQDYYYYYHGTTEGHSAFTYNQEGFQTGVEEWYVLMDGTEDHHYSVTWTYDEGEAGWRRKEVSSGEEKAEIIRTREPGTEDFLCFDGFPTGYYLYLDPYKTARVPDDCITTASYTYDKNGNTTRIDTYNPDGTLFGYCLLTWEEIHPAIRRNSP